MEKQIELLSNEFEKCRDILVALGDENRQHLILEMMKMKSCGGAQVNTITEKTNLSRPAVSHHLQILKRAGIIDMRKEGTKNFYYFSDDTQSLDLLIHVLHHAKEIVKELPDRSGEDE